jgi:hypothetical protein
MVAALENDELVREAPAIVGCKTPSALAHTADARSSEECIRQDEIRDQRGGTHEEQEAHKQR